MRPDGMRRHLRDMKKAFILCGLLVITLTGAQMENRFPNLDSHDLNGAAVSLPAGLPGERTILLVAFEREQQANLDAWNHGLKLEEGKLPWLELPVINNPGAFMRWFINTGMRGGIHGKETRSHVVTLYTDKTAFKAAVGIQTEKQVHVFVAGRTGEILAHVEGDFSPERAEQILRAASGK